MRLSALQGRLALYEPIEVLAAARALGITDVTLIERDGKSWWASGRAVKNGGSSGPCLDDYEAAVLIGAGAVRWGIWQSRDHFVLTVPGAGGAA
ncbi:MAG: hypothetical protein CVU47_12450 [Chloroflexi bacterium HGW-Chloroflexi-9]|nr:MAG: hypothetical protein CVU47_12450 [Chloroflexi bacterium HGW-Chloroflexi-9]